MTYTKLIERLREGQTHDFATGDLLDQSVAMDEAADAIEALQAENERLKSSLFTANRNNIRLVTAHLEQEEKTLAERDALQAKLDAMGKGEPVAYDDKSCADMPPRRVMERAHGFCPTELPHLDRMAWMADYFLRNYAAPKALAPLTDEQIYNVFASTVEDAEPFSELVGDPIWAEVVEVTRAIEAAHGIGGTP